MPVRPVLSTFVRRRAAGQCALIALSCAAALVCTACGSPVQATHQPGVPTVATAGAVADAPRLAVASASPTPTVTPVPPSDAAPASYEAQPQPARPESNAAPASSPEASPAPEPPPPAPPPVRVVIPKIGVNARVEPLGEAPDGSMDSPDNPYDVGWWQAGALPGDQGSAVLGGHVDYAGYGGAVFWNLHLLQPGDTVTVTSTEGTRLNFAVTEVATYRFDDTSPLDRIYLAADHRGLNLITCGGTFDPRTHNYDQRVVVYTTLVEGR